MTLPFRAFLVGVRFLFVPKSRRVPLLLLVSRGRAANFGAGDGKTLKAMVVVTPTPLLSVTFFYARVESETNGEGEGRPIPHAIPTITAEFRKCPGFFSPYVFPPSPPWNHRPDFFASSFTSASFSAVGSLFISTFSCQGLLPSFRKTKKVSNSLSSGSILNRTAPTV